MKLFLSIILYIITHCVLAVANIGVTTLFYSNQSDFSNHPIGSTPLESGVIPLMQKVNKAVTTKVQTRLAYFTPSLKKTLTESGAFNIFDAESTILKWNTDNTRLIYNWERESVTSDTEDAAAEKISADVESKSHSKTNSMIKPRTAPSGKYILIGWITLIKANEVRQIFPRDNSKTSVLYNLNIEVSYKIIDYDTKEVITQFVAAGHGGIGRVVPTNINHPVNLDDVANDVVDSAISSLLVSVKHGLLLKQDLGLLPK